MGAHGWFCPCKTEITKIVLSLILIINQFLFIMKTLKNFIPLLLFVALFALITQIPRAWGQDPPKCIPAIYQSDAITGIAFPFSEESYSSFKEGDLVFAYIKISGENCVIGRDVVNFNESGTIFPSARLILNIGIWKPGHGFIF